MQNRCNIIKLITSLDSCVLLNSVILTLTMQKATIMSAANATNSNI